MIRIYVARYRYDAWLVADRLAHAGIRSHVLNQHMQGIVGDVPPDVAQPQVWLDEDGDLERARAVLLEYEVEQQREGTRVCRHCQEENPATFDLCWRCGHALLT